MDETRPLFRALIIDEDVRLVEEPDETVFDAQFLSSGPRMVLSPRAPTVKLSTLFEEFANVTDDSGFGAFLSVDLLHQCVVDVDVDKQGIFHTGGSHYSASMDWMADIRAPIFLRTCDAMSHALKTLYWLFGVEVEAQHLTIFQVVLRAVVVFFATLVIVRLEDKRFFAKKTAFDLILGFILASMMARAINGSEQLLPTIAAGFVLALLHRFLGYLACHSNDLERSLKARLNK